MIFLTCTYIAKKFNKSFIHRNINIYHDSFRINEKMLTRLIIHCLYQLKVWIYINEISCNFT